MLVLSRKVGEEIRILDQMIVVRVLDVRGSSVRIGITAPDAVSIRRPESKEVDEGGQVERTDSSFGPCPVSARAEVPNDL